MSCRLLEKVAYYMRKPCVAENIVGEKITVRDTFPYNPDSKTAPHTAKRWAEQRTWRERDDDASALVPEVIVRDNEPFSITITDLEARSEGGRAYKIIDDEMRRFDLREDQVIEVMKNIGIQPGGKVPAKFAWGIVGSQVKLVVVGGELHEEMARGADEKKALETAQKSGVFPTETTLVPGRIYRKKDESIHLFLGRVKREGIDKVFYAFLKLPEFESVKEEDDFDLENMRVGGDMEYEKRYKDSRKYERNIFRNWSNLSWRERCHYAWVDRYNKFKAPGEKLYTYYPDIMLMSSPKFVADVGEFDVEFCREIRDNVKRDFHYVDGMRNDLVTKEFKDAYPDEQGYLSVEGWVSWRVCGWPRERDKKHEDKMNDAWKKVNDDFHNGLVWL